ncbi:MAG: acyltransferase [Candidatus Latescibacterota bacterium]
MSDADRHGTVAHAAAGPPSASGNGAVPPAAQPGMQVLTPAGSTFGLGTYWRSLLAYFGWRRALLWGIEGVVNMLLSPLPIVGGSQVRRLAYRRLLRRAGRGLMTAPGVRLLHSYNIEIGDRCSLSYGTLLNGRGGLVIGDDFTTGPGVMVLTAEHHYLDRDRRVLEQGEYEAPVRIGNDVWCGARAIVMPGVRVADGTVVAAGAVLTRDTEPYSVMAGVPARLLRYRVPGGGEPEGTTGRPARPAQETK